MEHGGPVEGRRRLHIQLLGRFEVRIDDHAVHLAAVQQRLVAFLALANGPTTRSRVAGVLWPEGREQRAMANLRSALWRLGQPGCGVVAATPTDLRLATAVSVDAHDLVRAAVDIREAGARADYAAAPPDIPLPAGELLPGWDDQWVVEERERLRQIRLHAVELSGAGLLRAGRTAAAAALARTVIDTDPDRESAHRLLIAAHLAEGDRSRALRQFRTYRTRLADGYEAEPSPAMIELVAPLTMAGTRRGGA